jgi:hypothetical protein
MDPTVRVATAHADTIRTRHPLGLPAGSVRAILALVVFGIIWAMLLLPEQEAKPIRIPLYLYYLMFLILGSYFATRGRSRAAAGVHESPPLHLPRGTLRFLMIGGFAAAIGWGFYHNPDFLRRLNPVEGISPDSSKQVYLPLVILGAFFLGLIVSRVATALFAHPVKGLPAWYQDLQAWVSLLAMICLGIEVIIRLLVYPQASPERKFELPHWEGFLSALVAFYFGARSGA